jgi:NACHT domain
LLSLLTSIPITSSPVLINCLFIENPSYTFYNIDVAGKRPPEDSRYNFQNSIAIYIQSNERIRSVKDWLDLLKQLGFQIAPWTIVIVLILYIFRERLNKALNALLDWLGTIFRGEWSYRRFERIFRPAIRAMHLYMRIVGIRFEKGREPTIPEAYVPLRIAPYQDENARNTNRISGNPTVGSAQVNQSPLSQQDKHWFIEAILQRHSALVVLGDPGAGKSTLLKYLITRFTEPRERKSTRNVSPRNLLALKHPQRSRSIIPCPLYVSLRACRTQNDTLLEDILDPETKILAGMLPSNQRKKMPQGFIESCVQKGRALLLLDGLDEVANEEMYADVVRKINDFYHSYPENRIVVTCRIAGWHSGLRGPFALYHALPLDRQQQHDFIARWYETAYKQNESDGAPTLLGEERLAGLGLLRDERKLSASEEASALERLFGERERLAELATNPMLLSLICLVYHLRRDLPRGRAALYEECVQILLGVWDRIDKGLNISKPTTDEKRKILRHVAFMLHTNGQKDISRQDFVSLVMRDLGISEEMARIVVRQIEVRSWLIVERVIDRLAFSHLTLQEFFVVEYLHTEKQDAIDFATIKDWNIWREPVLLMCGQSTNPTTFIEQVAAHNIMLAILCIVEADSTLLNVQRIYLLLDQALRLVHAGKLVLIDLLPALISLLAIEKSPFITQIMDFIKMHFGALDKVRQSDLIKATASSGTREAARLLLDLHLVVPDKGLEVLDGLVLIDGTAVEEALQWNRRGELNDGKLRELLLRSFAPEATRVLWERCGLEPRREIDEIAWAESWACRLTLAENDRLMHAIPYNGPIDAEIWPYRNSQRTVLAAIVQKCVQILRGIHEGKRYGGTKQQQEEFVDSIEHIAQFDLRVQIPLFLRLKVSQINVKDPRDKERIEAVLPDKHLLKEDAWYALVTARGKKNDENSWRTVGMAIATVGQFGTCVLLWAGVVALLWNVLPSWLSIAVIVVIFVSGMTTILLIILGSKDVLDDIPTPIGISLAILGLIFLTGYAFIWADIDEIMRWMATRKMKFWYPITLLIMVIACGGLGGLAIERWFHLALPLSILIVGFGSLLCTVLQGWMSALSARSMLPWLERHPRGQVVLDELRG